MRRTGTARSDTGTAGLRMSRACQGDVKMRSNGPFTSLVFTNICMCTSIPTTMPSAKWRLELGASVRTEAHHLLAQKTPASASTRAYMRAHGMAPGCAVNPNRLPMHTHVIGRRRQGRTTYMDVNMGCTHLYINAHCYLGSSPSTSSRAPSAPS